jgi:hypothetical protein
MSRQEVTAIRRNARESICVAWDSYEGHVYVDLRIFFEDGADLKPSKKGLTIPPRLLDEVIDALQDAKAMGQKLRLITKDAA